jgi:hypothetical protein
MNVTFAFSQLTQLLQLQICQLATQVGDAEATQDQTDRRPNYRKEIAVGLAAFAEVYESCNPK